ncbi:MAG: tRNA pseudouridine(55) synthase TruB [Deltaproteobacteria bacterium]|nr:tRNA pseudouridine(55) synthase TruB [Deltaproteobacteria bacterium]
MSQSLPDRAPISGPPGELSGLLLLDKPSGPTSFSLVREVRRIAGQRAVGHLGTLDPLATGLLGALLGPATRLADQLMGLDKTYLARVVVGLATSTDDVTGQVWRNWTGPWPSEAQARAALSSFLGPSSQRPPAYSAIKRGGQVAHRAARAGRPLELMARPVVAHRLDFLSWEPPEIVFRAQVSSGYYIRSLARDLGESLGLGGGALKELRREVIGPFVLTPGQAMPQDRAELADRLLSPRAALMGWPEVILTEDETRLVRQGQPVSLRSPWPPSQVELSQVESSQFESNQFKSNQGQLTQGQPRASEPDQGPRGEPRVPAPVWEVKIIDSQGQLVGLGQIITPGLGSGEPRGPFLRPSRVLRAPLGVE